MTEIPTATGIPAPPYDDDGDDEPAFVPRPRRRARALTVALAGAALVGAGFLGGVLVQKHEDKAPSSSSNLASIASRLGATRGGAAATGATPGAGTGTRGGFGGGAGGGAVVGTVKLVDGDNVYVTETSGNVVKVTTSAATQISRTDPATTKSLAPNDTVIVRGATQSNGDVAATSLVATPAGQTGGFGGLAGAAAAGG